MRAAVPAPEDDGQVARPFPPDLHDVRHLQLKAGLLVVWALVSFGASFFARDLSLMWAGWQLGYWIASQGAVLVFIATVLVYALAMSYFEGQDGAAPVPAAPSTAGRADG